MVSTSLSSEAPSSIKNLTFEPSNIGRFSRGHFFFSDSENSHNFRKSDLKRYAAQKEYLGDLSIDAWTKLVDQGLGILKRSYADESGSYSVQISLSNELQTWRDEQLAIGRVLPAKGYGLEIISDACLDLLSLRDVPSAVLTNDAIFGIGVMNMGLGAYDPKVCLSNYIVDCSFYSDHGYHRYFPDFDTVIEEALNDQYARSTPGGAYRRDACKQGLRYVRTKTALEEENSAKLANKSAAHLTRHEAILLLFCDSSMTGFDGEAIALGADVGGVIAHSVIAQLLHGVVDVGSDLQNSEMFNSFLIPADIASNGGELTEDILRRVYDTYAALGARACTDECFEPAARGPITLLSWQMQDERHNWLRRIVLGYTKIRKHKGGLREAVFEEAFDENFHTTGLSRPLKNPCNCETVCDQVKAYLAKSHNDPLVKDMWYYLAEAPLEYGSKGIIDEEREKEIVEGSRVAICRAFSYGLTNEITWILGHATLHAWQVSYLFEASMFGSFLDDGRLKGGVDWYQG